jgi:hypothetical protein
MEYVTCLVVDPSETNMMMIMTTRKKSYDLLESALLHVRDNHNPGGSRRQLQGEGRRHLQEEYLHLQGGDLRHHVVVLPLCYLRLPAWRKRLWT